MRLPIALALSLATVGRAQSATRTVAPGDSVRVILLDGTAISGILDGTTDSTVTLRGGAGSYAMSAGSSSGLFLGFALFGGVIGAPM